MIHIEDIELQKRRHQLDKDVARLLDKYLSIVEWDVPDTDQDRVRRLIIDEIRQALERLDSVG